MTRDSHFVPQWLMREWSIDDATVWVHRRLVSHENVPLWERVAVKGTAFRRDLYTEAAAGGDNDAFERFVTNEIEEPACGPVRRLVSGGQMRPADWRAVARFVVFQHLRTPLYFAEAVRRWKPQIEGALANSVAEFERAMASGGIDAEDHVAAPNYLRDVVRVTAVPEEGGIRLETTIKSPRSFWLASIRRLLEDNRGVIQALRWRTAVPFGAEEWPLADHPVLTLEYNSATDYRSVGGFGRPGCEIIMPISPRLAVYARVGDSKLGRFQFSKDETRVLQRLLMERSWRFVISRAPIPQVEAEHPREVNAERFVEEEAAWRAWHQIQSASEKAFDRESNAPVAGPR